MVGVDEKVKIVLYVIFDMILDGFSDAEIRLDKFQLFFVEIALPIR